MATRPEAEEPKPAYQICGPVFFGSAILIVLFVLFGATMPDLAATIFDGVQTWITETFGWFYVLTVAIFIVFAFSLALSQHGNVRLGPDDSSPDYTYVSWFAMLFSAGMGIGLMFFGVAEPIMHYATPPVGEGGTIEAARQAMTITFFHWGLHAWAIYSVIGLSLAYFSFRHGLPLTIRSALYPLIGNRIAGFWGHLADIFAVLGTMFGVATSLGLGVLQINAGLTYLFDVPEGIGVQLVLIVVITMMATASVVAGLDAGIRRLSELNLLLAVALLLFVLTAGPTLFLFQVLVQNIGTYLSNVVSMTFRLYAYEPNTWIGGWTLFYWAWWIAWSPFVGMFIARVSRGRTIREFVLGVLLVPAGFTFMWMTFFGNTAIDLDLGIAQGAISAAVAESVPTALFRFLEFFPFSAVSSLLATILVVTFFVTSSDSGSLVIDTITSGGVDDPPVWQRIFWATSEGLVAAVLLMAGGLNALQTASIAAALPFAFVMLFVCYGLLRGLRMEAQRQTVLEMPPIIQIRGASVPWQQWLKTIVTWPRREEVESFLRETVEPALREVAEEFRQAGLEATVAKDPQEISLTIAQQGAREFLYAVHAKGYSTPAFALPDTSRRRRSVESRRYFRADVRILEGPQHYDVMGYTKEQIIGDVLTQYDKHVRFLIQSG